MVAHRTPAVTATHRPASGRLRQGENSAFASAQSNDSPHSTVEHTCRTSNPRQCSSLVMSPVNTGNRDYMDRTHIRDVIPCLEMNGSQYACF